MTAHAPPVPSAAPMALTVLIAMTGPVAVLAPGALAVWPVLAALCLPGIGALAWLLGIPARRLPGADDRDRAAGRAVAPPGPAGPAGPAEPATGMARRAMSRALSWALPVFGIYALLSVAWTPDPAAAAWKWGRIAIACAAAAVIWRHTPAATGRDMRLLVGGVMAGYGLLLVESVLALPWIADSAPSRGSFALAVLSFAAAAALRCGAGEGRAWGLLAAAAACTIWSADNVASQVAIIVGLGAAVAARLLSVRWRLRLAALLIAGACLTPLAAALMAHNGLALVLEDIIPQAHPAHRLAVYDASFLLFLERPLFGGGFFSARTVEAGVAFLHPHNVPLQVMLELGLTGLALGGLLLASVVRGIAALAPPLQPHAIGALAAALSIGAFSLGAWQTWWVGLLCGAVWLFIMVNAAGDTDTGGGGQRR